MAGRGTDIVLGGNYEAEIKAMKNATTEEVGVHKRDWEERHKKVIDSGGLHIIGTERHESRRIDNQLRGRCGRQGDPGSTRFFVSFEDEMVKRFAPDWLSAMIDRLVDDGQPLESKQLTGAIAVSYTHLTLPTNREV